MARLRARPPLLLLFLLAAAPGCSEAEDAQPQALEPAVFTILGRWRGPLEIRYALEAGEEDPPLLRAVEEAAEIWNATGIVRLRPSGEGETADVVFSYQSGRHGECIPFGANEGMAHAGPTQPPSFVHFDRARAWALEEQAGYSLSQAAAHEFGHLLGLGHTEDESALMYPVPDWKRNSLRSSDLAALHSLYGGGEDGDGDLFVQDSSGERVASLRRVAPRDLTDVGVLDTDGDGDEEILVWRTDRAGYGKLMIYHFEPGPLLARTVGPIPGMVPAEVPHVTGVAANGDRLLISLLPDGRWLGRRFDEEGLPRPLAPDMPLELGEWRDGDGDGRWDAPDALEAFIPPAAWAADLDGDGRPETITRR